MRRLMTSAAQLPRESFTCHLEALEPAIRSKFTDLSATAGSAGMHFLESFPPHSAFEARLRTVLQAVFGLKNMDGSALLGHNAMHCIDTKSAEILLDVSQGSALSLLDVGAGTGYVTAQLSPLFAEVVATEASYLAAWRARRSHGIDCRHTAEIPDSGFDVVSMLNVLDRCHDPLLLLTQAADAVRKQGNGRCGLLLLTLALPYTPYIVVGDNGRMRVDTIVLSPEKRLLPQILPPAPLPFEFDSEEQEELYVWERSVNWLVTEVFHTQGLELKAVSRVPYLCQGDANIAPFYLIDDALFVLRVPMPAGD